jgi:DNA-binding CsgD family transcriptional regulator
MASRSPSPSFPGADERFLRDITPHLQALTPRERGLLGYLVQGLTYAEIAATLVISEKTVSSPFSNLLRKTSTSSRIELARLVTRLQSCGAERAQDSSQTAAPRRRGLQSGTGSWPGGGPQSAAFLRCSSLYAARRRACSTGAPAATASRMVPTEAL